MELSQRDAKTLLNAAKIARENIKSKKAKTMANGLESMVTDIMGESLLTPQINRTETLELNLRRQPLTFERPTLSSLYQEYGIIRAAIDQPVDDALRGGVDFKSPELDADDLKLLTDYMEEQGVWDSTKTTMKWAELFGGAGLIVNNGQDSSTPLDLKSMDERSPLAFFDADRWELGMPNDDKRPDMQGLYTGELFYYYGRPLHRSRVFTMIGDKAPSLYRRMLMGWGLSKCEKMVRDLNQYLKAINVIFELLDEAKVDVYRLQGYKSALARPQGEAKMRQAIGLTNSMKNFLNALILDKEDEYDQKQLTFSGLAEMLKEIRIGIASCVRMPVAKLFGLSAAGFNSGEDDIENYNGMIESDIRPRLRPVIKSAVSVACIKLFGYQPPISFDYKSLRVMSQNEEEDMKGKKQTRILNNYDRGLITAKENMETQRAEGLLTAEKTAAEQGLTEDFPVPPVERVTQTIKNPDPNANPAEDDVTNSQI